MKFSIVLGYAAASVMAFKGHSIAERDVSVVTDILEESKTNIKALDEAIKNYDDDKAPLLKASNDLIDGLKEGKTKVEGIEPLTLDEAVSLTGPVKELTDLAQTLADDAKAVRETIEKLGECTLVRQQVTSIGAASQELIKAVVSKVPEEAQSIAEQLSAGLIDILNQSKEDFSEENCVDSGSPGGGSSEPAGGSTSAPPAGSTSAPPAETSKPAETSSAPGGGSPQPTGGNGSPTHSDSPPVVTGGAAAMAPLGGLVVAVAALMA